jgi:NADPH-dependent 2,4-dienoyl-CoA reductase/sulfur reductase-like enzyme
MAKSLIRLGKEIKFLFHEDAFWPVRFDQEVYDQAAHQLSQKGVEVVPGKKIASINPLSEGRFEVQVDDKKIQTGIVGAFFGLVPDIGFLAHSGLQIERGVLVDEYLFCGFDGVFAAGDCAQVYHPDLHDYWVSIGHDNAVNLGKIAAVNLAGGSVKADLKSESIFLVDGIRANISWWMGF